jgi:uncharacterized Zn-binding protein involved in type VI secretion
MPAAVRFSDRCSGHGCWGPRPNDQGSPNVFINNLASHRLTDGWQAHCCLSCHRSQACEGSPNVFVNNLNKCRIGDAVCCGSVMVQGSPNVFVNGL